MSNSDQNLDLRGLNCPMPILYTKKALAKMSSGEQLRIVATDSGTLKDFEAFSRQTGNALLESREEQGKFHFLIRKA